MMKILPISAVFSLNSVIMLTKQRFVWHLFFFEYVKNLNLIGLKQLKIINNGKATQQPSKS